VKLTKEIPIHILNLNSKLLDKKYKEIATYMVGKEYAQAFFCKGERCKSMSCKQSEWFLGLECLQESNS